MQNYHFRSVTGRLVTVQAVSEEDGRRLAMTALWGPSTYTHEYRGHGLSLVEG